MGTAPRGPGRVDALADALTSSNQQVALLKYQELARAFGVSPPQDITDESVRAGIEERAQTSAASIVRTQAERAAQLIAEHGSGAAAQPYYDDWAAGQADVISQYEAAMTSSIATNEWIERNAATGTAHVEPTSSVGADDSCNAAIACGEIPIDQIDIDLPAHPRCPHAWVFSFDRPVTTRGLWFGGAD